MLYNEKHQRNYSIHADLRTTYRPKVLELTIDRNLIGAEREG